MIAHIFDADFLQNMRARLELVWNNETRHQKTIVSPNDPISRGQCGVTSAHLAAYFIEKGFTTYFCEGDVLFLDNTSPIINHCWLTILSDDDTYIIDLTVDQTGFHKTIIAASVVDIEQAGIIYTESKRYKPAHMDMSDLLRRVDILRKGLQK